MNNGYFETLAAAIQGAFAEAATAKALLPTLSDDNASALESLERPMNYGEQRRADFVIAQYKGRPTRKLFHVVIARLDSGTYELITYVL